MLDVPDATRGTPLPRPSVADVAMALRELVADYRSPLAGLEFSMAPSLPINIVNFDDSLLSAEDPAVSEPLGNESGLAERSPTGHGHHAHGHGTTAAMDSPARPAGTALSIGRLDPGTRSPGLASPRSTSPRCTSSPRACSPSPRASSPCVSSSGGKRVYTCPECSRPFSSGSNMTRHRRIHTGDRPFACMHCNVGFSNSSNRRKHERTCKRRPGGEAAGAATMASPSVQPLALANSAPVSHTHGGAGLGPAESGASQNSLSVHHGSPAQFVPVMSSSAFKLPAPPAQYHQHPPQPATSSLHPAAMKPHGAMRGPSMFHNIDDPMAATATTLPMLTDLPLIEFDFN